MRTDYHLYALNFAILQGLKMIVHAVKLEAEHLINTSDERELLEHLIITSDERELLEHLIITSDERELLEHLIITSDERELLEHLIITSDERELLEHLIITSDERELLVGFTLKYCRAILFHRNPFIYSPKLDLSPLVAKWLSNN